ncbi:retrovirus-related pol polyprotein from transposon TNT 1-94 [Tanacetum coccineum]
MTISHQPQAEFHQLVSGLAVLAFLPGDDLIACMNKGQNVVGSGLQRNASGLRGNTSGQAKVVKSYNCQGEGHMARQCTQPKRRRDATWFKEKVLLLNKLAEDFGKRFVPQQELSAEQMFWLQSSNKNSKVPSTSNTPIKTEVPKELPKDFSFHLEWPVEEPVDSLVEEPPFVASILDPRLCSVVEEEEVFGASNATRLFALQMDNIWAVKGGPLGWIFFSA